jgi:CofH/MqnC C-terminal region
MEARAMMTTAEAQAILENPNLIEIGVRADEARRALHGTRVTFVRVMDVPVSGVNLSAVPVEAGEIRLVGKPESLAQVESGLRALAASGAGGHTQSLTGFALHDLTELGELSVVARRLKDWGLEAIAEVAIDRLSHPAEAIRTVHATGLQVARLTVHEPARDPVDLLAKARDAAGAFAGGVAHAFAPLPRRLDPASPTTGYDDVKLVALARLFLDNVDAIQVDWSLYGPKLAQVALTFGASDLDAVSLDPPSVNLLGPRRAPLEDVLRNIRAASFVPVRRNGRFETIEAPEPAAGATR